MRCELCSCHGQSALQSLEHDTVLRQNPIAPDNQALSVLPLLTCPFSCLSRVSLLRPALHPLHALLSLIFLIATVCQLCHICDPQDTKLDSLPVFLILGSSATSMTCFSLILQHSDWPINLQGDGQGGLCMPRMPASSPPNGSQSLKLLLKSGLIKIIPFICISAFKTLIWKVLFGFPLPLFFKENIIPSSTSRFVLNGFSFKCVYLEIPTTFYSAHYNTLLVINKNFLSASSGGFVWVFFFVYSFVFNVFYFERTVILHDALVSFILPSCLLPWNDMGYCILFVHGLSKLCAWLNRCGVTTLSVSTVLLLLLFSWKTVKQNEIWLSRESLFRLYPRHASALNNLGTLTRDTAEAKMYYQRALQLNPQHNRALFNLGNLLNALQVARKTEILSPLGALYYNTGRYEEALQTYREAVALQPSQRELRLALAQVLAVMGQTKEAEKMTSHIVSEETGCLECYRLLSAIHSKQEQHDKALDAIDKALKLKPKDPKVISELFFTKGNQLREQNLLDKAFESYKAAVELNPDQAQAWMNMGGIQHIRGNYVSARTYYERALQLVPDSKLLQENLAKLDRLEKRLQEVREKNQT
ncbi:hypothetical protein FD754_012062 [Muntiacus muntjak]|uniref:Uncharacterized protein n=1 Tax=Muntiacus muntjak TaxID=9888 RepID=A0A5N3VFN8_MUNMU|nr:hypothetical protein FD754_012062 [Muntiacus muntjak]